MIEAREAVEPAAGPIALLLNRRGRQSTRTEAAVAEALGRRGLRLERVVRVARPAGLVAAVDELTRHDLGRLIVGGGDGTIGTVAARLAQRPVDLGVIPLGTANDLARTLAIPWRLAAAAEVAAGSRVLEVDLGRANDHFFLNVASVGISVAVTRRLSSRMKRRLGPAAYAVAGALTMARHAPFLARLECPGSTVEAPVHMVVIGNGRFFGGGVLVARGSRLDDGQLAIYTLGRRSRWQLLSTFTLLRFGVPLHRPGDVYFEAPTATLSTDPPGQPVNLDGELRTTTPVTLTVVPRALRVVAPE